MAVGVLVLGPPEVRGATACLPVDQPAVFGALVVNANAPVTPARLATAMWDTPPPSWEAEVRDSVEALRGLIDSAGRPIAGRLVAYGPDHLLTVEPEELDLDRFTLLFRQGRAALDADDHHAASHLLDEALATWRGPAGGAWAHGWLARRFAGIERLRSSAAESRLVARLALGQRDRVASEAHALVAADPQNERWWALLIAGLRDSGDPAAARAAHERARQAYVDEFGLLPDHVRRLLHLAQQPAPRRGPA
jgi:DNA-binding SARP family transcriptional activator